MTRSVFLFTDSPQLGGAEEALLRLLEQLDRSRWRPTLLYHDRPALAPLAERARALDVPVRAVPPLPLGLEGARRTPGFARELRRARPDVFHAHLSWPLAAKFPLAAAVLARVPAVVATVQLFPPFPLDRSSRIQERVLAAGVGRYVAVSHAVATQLQQVLGVPARKLAVVHNGVDAGRWRRPRGEALRRQLCGGAGEAFVFLTAARLDEQKGLDVLLEAARDVPEARFVLAGDGPERARLEAAAKRLGLGGRVVFLGRRSDVPELLAASDAFVLPSLYEGSSLALLEAMAAGRAVVATAIPGTDELVVDGESGLLVPPRDAAGLAAALRRVAADAGLRTRLGEAASERVTERFSAAAAAERVARVYDELLRARGES